MASKKGHTLRKTIYLKESKAARKNFMPPENPIGKHTLQRLINYLTGSIVYLKLFAGRQRLGAIGKPRYYRFSVEIVDYQSGSKHEPY
ncbi:MAG: hypothetical protein HYY41_03790 [Chloroflexi bacterium]|nr:hypothetical protein [Chloroflexota bacterium]MBI2979932.1 hypothetical protein [Chloroflexota bacterium]